MKKKNLMLRISYIVAFLVLFGLGQNAWAQTTYYSQVASPDIANATTDWNTQAGGGGTFAAPVANDIIIIQDGHTWTLGASSPAFDGVTVESGGSIVASTYDLLVNGTGAGNLAVSGSITSTTGAITVKGTTTIASTGSLTSTGGTKTFTGAVTNAGTLNLTGTTATMGAGFTNTAGTTTVGTSLVVTGNVQVTDANVVVNAAGVLTITGNLTLAGTSSLTAQTHTAEVTFNGGIAQSITASEDSYLEFGILNVATANTAVTTASDFTVRNYITTAASTSFNATAGVVTFNPAAASVLWNTNATGPLSLYDVLINTGAFTGTPATNATIKGDLTKIGAQPFLPTASTITFQNSSALPKNIQLAGNTTDGFFNLAVATGSKVETSSSFSIAGDGAGAINVIGTGSFIAQAGTITLTGAAATIVNSANGTLKFNNLVNDVTAVATTTASNFTIAGNFSNLALGIFGATAGTITFENNVLKTIVNTNDVVTDLIFWNVNLAAGSKITSANNFTVRGNLTLAAASEMEMTGTAITNFDGGTTKTITVAPTAELIFNNLTITDIASNVVATASDFTVAGNMIYADVTAHPSFNATAGTVTFTNAIPTITSSGNNPMSFYNLEIDGGTVTLAASQLISIKKDLILNKETTDGVLTVANATPTVTFLGTENSKITGTSEATIPATFGVLTINKTDATDEVLLELDAAIFQAGTINLTSGILNLGDENTFTSGAGTITGTGINGGTSTYIITTGHLDGLSDALFTIDGEPTLWNLTVGEAHETGAALTVKNDLDWSAAVALTIANPGLLTLYGDLLQTAAGTIVGADAAGSVLKLTGEGSAVKLDNVLLATRPSLTFERGETLTGALTMIGANVLSINTSVNVLNIGANTLTLDDGTILNLVSGSIKADAGTVVLGTHASQTTIPANLFTDNIVNNLTIGAATTLGGDVTVNGTLAGLHNVTTNNNTLTFGPNATLPAYVDATHIVGNLRRTVTTTATVFPVGGGGATSFRPLTLQFGTAGSSQVVTVSSALTNPVFGRGGDPTRSVNALWTITPEGTSPSGNMIMGFGWGTEHDNGLAGFANNKTFITKWGGTSWIDYRTSAVTYAAGPPKVLSTDIASIPASALAGEWAIFDATANTNPDKDAAIAVNRDKLAITAVNPNPVDNGFPFTVTVQFQDQYGNPKNVPSTAGALTINFGHVINNGGIVAYPTATIPVGQNSVTVPGFLYPNASLGNQFSATVTAAANNPDTLVFHFAKILPAVSPAINVLETLPGEQVSGITLGGGTLSTTMSFTLTAPGEAIILAKAGSPITSDEFPVDGTTYFASNNFGQGSTIGGAVVVYKGLAAGTPVTINGLAPQTTYYFRGFAYDGDNGSEKYIKFSSANNPRNFTTGGGIDDDAVYGSNNTFATAKPIGTNSTIRGTLRTTDDVDFFSFAVTNASPNIRTTLVLDAIEGNYNIELLNSEGKLLRRGTRMSNGTESPVINDLPAGTYVIRIYGVDGDYDPSNAYTITVKTSGEEIFSVTP